MSLIATLTLNPAVDLSMSVDRVVPHDKLRVTDVVRDPGGGGINVARVIHRLGGAVTAVYAAGGPMGDLLQCLIEREGLCGDRVSTAEWTRESITADERSTGKQYRFVLPGPHLGEDEWSACLDRLSRLTPPPAYVVASGSLPPGVPDDFHVVVGDLARRIGARFVLDTSGAALKAGLDGGVFLAKPNLREMRELTGRELTDEPSRVAAVRELLDAGRAQAIALTLGPEGGILVTTEGAWRAVALAVKPVSAVGAGDSFVGAMVHRLNEGSGFEEAFRYAMAAGGAALITPGTDLCHADDVERFAREVRVEPIV